MVHTDPQSWAEMVSTTIPIRICEPKQQSAFYNETAVVQIGTVTAVATQGSPVTVSTDDSATAQLMVPYQGNADWRCGDQAFENPAGVSLLFAPPCPLRLENTITSGIALNYSPNTLLSTAITMAGATGARLNLNAAFAQPQQLMLHDIGNRELVACIYRTLRSIDELATAAPQAMALLNFGDLLTRLLVLLLVPALRQGASDADNGDADNAARQRLNQLTAWIDAHLQQPLGLSDLERQSGYSRRALQYLFRHHLGCSPMQWLRYRRLDKAMENLKHRPAPTSISAVAAESGYASLAAFSRDFRARHGKSPSAVLRANRWR